MNRRKKNGFTLIELLVVISIIAVLVAVSIPVFKGLRGRAERAQSIQNLKSIYTALSSHLNDYGSWPQPPESGIDEKFEFWKETLKPYGIEEENLIALAHLRTNEETARRTGSYMIIEFESGSDIVPRQYANQPWVMEAGNFDGSGHWMIRANGKIDQEVPLFAPTVPVPASAPGKKGL